MGSTKTIWIAATAVVIVGGLATSASAASAAESQSLIPARRAPAAWIRLGGGGW